MRKPILIFPLGLLIVVAAALIAVYFEVMSSTELISKFKSLAILLVPIVLLGVVFMVSARKGPKS
jgi:hypothetical protein